MKFPYTCTKQTWKATTKKEKRPSFWGSYYHPFVKLFLEKYQTGKKKKKNQPLWNSLTLDVSQCSLWIYSWKFALPSAKRFIGGEIRYCLKCAKKIPLFQLPACVQCMCLHETQKQHCVSPNTCLVLRNCRVIKHGSDIYNLFENTMK